MPHLIHVRSLACGLLLAGALLPATAAAQDAKPTPTSCAGLTFEDPPGDQDLSVAGVSTGYETQENLDITAGFFRYVPEGGRNVLTANIEIANLTSEAESGSSGHTYYFYFDLADGTHFVSANLATDGSWTFGVGDLAISGPGNTQTGETTGKVFEGPEGIISIVVPVTELQIEGKSLSTPYASSRVAFRSPTGHGLVPTADDGPDGQNGKTYRVTPCLEGGGAPPPTDPGTPGAPDPGGQPPSEEPATLDVTVTAPKLSAKKLRKKRSAVFGLNAREEITSLTARLYRGSGSNPVVFATGKLARIEGSGKLKLRFSRKAARRLKAGVYTLDLSGRKADGRSATRIFQVSIRR